jgi:hypothetical protein
VAFSFDNLYTTAAIFPPRVLIYGPPNVGKTTLASEFPDAIFVQTEDGAGALSLTTFKAPQDGPMSSFDEVLEALTLLASGEHSFKTMVLDGLDKLEPLIWRHVCAKNKWSSIEDPGFGKGYLEVDKEWMLMFSIIEYLRINRMMTIVYLAHDEITTAPDPSNAEYKRFTPRLHKRAHALVVDEMDVIGFMHQQISVTESEAGAFGKKTTKAEGGHQRVLVLSAPAFCVAKCRFPAPAKIIITPGAGYTALAPFLPAQPAAA